MHAWLFVLSSNDNGCAIHNMRYYLFLSDESLLLNYDVIFTAIICLVTWPPCDNDDTKSDKTNHNCENALQTTE